MNTTKTLCCVLVPNSEHAAAADLGGVQADDRVHFGGGGGDDQGKRHHSVSERLSVVIVLVLVL